MKIFSCSQCQQLLFFENSVCTRCGANLAYLPDVSVVSAMQPLAAGDAWSGKDDASGAHVLVALAPAANGRSYRLCANYIDYAACNWAVPLEDEQKFCPACRLNQMIPDLSDANAKQAWVRLELAKRRLVYTLLLLGTPLESKAENPEKGLAFAFKQDSGHSRVMTGHNHGLVTINIAEADDVFREKMRVQMSEPYRTVLGHFRHEVGHYYWERLVMDTPRHASFRALFGDEREDYAASLSRHYQQGAPADWQQRFVSQYASMHPWEDWAETFAHYLHMVDTLETARSYGLALRPQAADGTRAQGVAVHRVNAMDFDDLVNAWFPVTVALNSFNRGMGLPDLYPFVLGARTVEKLRFVHELLAASRMEMPGDTNVQPGMNAAASVAPGGSHVDQETRDTWPTSEPAQVVALEIQR